jgi:sterol desaturase/sphingolipid hydroxylase (fatty acid hydroxylase superfamily)
LSRRDQIFAVTVFPLVMSTGVGVAIFAMQRGWDPALAILPPTAGGALLVLFLERIFPHHRSWLRSRGDVRVDAAHVVSVTLTTSLLQAPIAFAGGSASAWVATRVGAPLWPASWPLLAQLALALVVAELPKYWLHRLEHEHDILWRFHATHHSAPRLYWLNAARFHPVDIALDTLAGGLTLAALAVPAPVIALFALVAAIHGYFQHANLKLRLGPLNYFFSMAELHRWHHSRTVAESNHNYGQNLIVWDLVFGTFFLPRDRQPPEEIGLADLPAFPMTYWQQLASPFRWRRIRTADAPAGRATAAAG